MSFKGNNTLTWEHFTHAIDRMVEMVRSLPISSIYGHPRGGLVPAVTLSHALELPLVDAYRFSESTLWVDEIYDTGHAYRNWSAVRGAPKHALVWYTRKGATLPAGLLFVDVEEADIWMEFPWEKKYGQS